MSQTHKRSMIEATTQMGVGFLVSLLLTVTVLPLPRYGLKADFNQYAEITLISRSHHCCAGILSGVFSTEDSNENASWK